MGDDTAAQRVRDQAVPDDVPVQHVNVFEQQPHNEDYDRLTRAILKLSRGGWSTRQIARDLAMPDQEVEAHLNRVN